MQIHRNPRHDRDFVIIANRAIQDPRMSHTARGILALVLSLPNGVKENVRTLSDNYPQGRSAVAKAVKELRDLGYWVTKTTRDEETNHIVSSVDVYETPALASSPVPTRPVTDPAATRNTGTSPYGEKDLSKDGDKNPPFPPAEPVQDEAAPFGAEEGEGSSDKQDDKQAAEAARILRRFAAIDARLKLSDRQVSRLVPAVADWLDRGATISEITDAVTAGLPAKLYSASKLIADRLDRKRPERKRQWKQYAECADRCGNLLPAGQDTGICAECALGTGPVAFEIDCTTGEVTDHAPAPVAPVMPDVASRAAEIRALLRA
ncbi:helix-turn-helix domain-containing protein [Streptomyces sp. NPDC019507]|uniref:helix-turn-helix domain-containing protein n=1 Tax=Streptomyces sp. NPDC019507 TaxID=3154689 RepID=UPI0033DAAEAB